ncbi:MAG TPA: metalloregulator ArsR/SmtB family transcription factor [Clostridia bacterium]|nr:metalloregulator ArsR/SmtB family transcription factor [Clostridia bacterium]
MHTFPNMNPKSTETLSGLFKTLGDPTRLRIISTLFPGEKCVHEISNQLNMTHSAVSHQLSILKQNHLVKYRRDGRHMRYSLDDTHVEDILRLGILHIEHINKELWK